MNNPLKTALISVLFSTLLTASVYAEQQPVDVEVYQVPLQFEFDGEQFAPPAEQQGFIYEGSVYVPLRFVAYSLNRAVRWDGDSYTVTVEEPKDTDSIQISEYNLNTKVRGGQKRDKFDASSLQATKLQAYKESVQYVFQGVKKETNADLPGFIVQDTLYVPMRFFSESVGKKMDWDPVSYTVGAKTQEAPKPVEQPKTVEKPIEKPIEKPKETQPVAPAPVSGGGDVKPSYDSIISNAEGKISALQLEATSYFFGLLTDYKAVTDPEAKAAKKAELTAQAEAKLTEYDNRFAALMANLQSDLTSNGYETTKIAGYQAEYEAAKAAARALYTKE